MTTTYSIRTRFLLLAVMAGVALAAPVAQAQQIPSATPINRGGLPDFLSRWFPQWFGEEDTGPRPEDTLQAPFANPAEIQAVEAAKAAEARQGIIFQSADGHTYRRMVGEDGRTYELPDYTPAGPDAPTGPLEEAHRRQDQIAEWLVRATSEIFTMDSTNYQKHLAHLATGMSEGGLADFNKFMQDSNIFSKLQADGVQLKGYVEEPPLLLNEGPLNGRYRWLFEMPVTVTFIAPSSKGYREKGVDPAEQSLRFIVQTQIGRVEKGSNEDNVVIETWRIRANPLGKSSLPQ